MKWKGFEMEEIFMKMLIKVFQIKTVRKHRITLCSDFTTPP